MRIENFIPTGEVSGDDGAPGDNDGVAGGADVLIISKRLSPTALPM